MNRTPNLRSDGETNQDEQELIAFHLGESCDERGIRSRLDTDPAFAELSASVAHTLRFFSAESVPTPDTAAAWQRLRYILPQVEPVRRMSPWNWFVLAPVSALCFVVLAICLVSRTHHLNGPQVDDAGATHLRPPQQSVSQEDIALHLDRAERWLTAVNHASAPLEASTISEGDQLLVNNAAYVRDAHNRGDLPDAAILERLGRVITTAHHPSEDGVQLRIEMNTDGLLFDLRVLRQNQAQSTGVSQ
jgi:hypothetical protein